MNMRKALKVACAMKGTNMASLEAAMYGSSGNLYHMTNPDKVKGGMQIGTVEKIAKHLNMKASELIALGEDE